MAERSKAAVLKTVIPSDRNRGFESLSLLQRLIRSDEPVRYYNQNNPDLTHQGMPVLLTKIMHFLQ